MGDREPNGVGPRTSLEDDRRLAHLESVDSQVPLEADRGNAIRGGAAILHTELVRDANERQIAHADRDRVSGRVIIPPEDHRAGTKVDAGAIHDLVNSHRCRECRRIHLLDRSDRGGARGCEHEKCKNQGTKAHSYLLQGLDCKMPLTTTYIIYQIVSKVNS